MFGIYKVIANQIFKLPTILIHNTSVEIAMRFNSFRQNGVQPVSVEGILMGSRK